MLRLANNAVALLASSFPIGATSFSVAAGQGAAFAALSAGEYLYVTFEDASGNIEVVRCTGHAAASDSFTGCTRGLDGTTERAWSAGDAVEMRGPALVLRDLARQSPKTLSANYTVVADDLGRVLLCDASAASFTLALSAAATLREGFWVAVLRTDITTARLVTIDPAGSETVNGALSLALGPYERVTLLCTGSAWVTYPASTSAQPLAASQLEVGARGQANTPTLDLHSGAVDTDYDVRLAATGGTGAPGAGALDVSAAQLRRNGNTVWDAGTDGPGSGLDADTVDGLQGSALITTSGGNIPTGTLGFGTTARQMVDLYTTTQVPHAFGIGVQNNTTYLRTSSGFAVHVGGAHAPNAGDPGPNGQQLLWADAEGLAPYFMGQPLWHLGYQGPGTGMNADTVDGWHGADLANIPARLGFNPVHQGGGAGMGNNTVYLGWNPTLGLTGQIDATPLGRIWSDNQAAVAASTPGYVMLPNGIRFVWGYSSLTLDANGNGAIMYPLVFNNVYTVLLTNGSITNNAPAYDFGYIQAGSNTYGFNFGVRPNPGAIPVICFWAAIGN